MKKTTGPGKGKPMMKDMKPATRTEKRLAMKKEVKPMPAQMVSQKTEVIKPMGIAKTTKMEGPKSVSIPKRTLAPKPGRSVVKTKGIYSRSVDGKDQMVKEKTKTVTKGGLTKKTVVKGKGMAGSVIGKYKEVKKFK